LPPDRNTHPHCATPRRNQQIGPGRDKSCRLPVANTRKRGRKTPRPNRGRQPAPWRTQGNPLDIRHKPKSLGKAKALIFHTRGAIAQDPASGRNSGIRHQTGLPKRIDRVIYLRNHVILLLASGNSTAGT
jgi:hypothetical protein